MKSVSHIFPFPKQFIQNLSVCRRGAVKEYDSSWMDTSQQFVKCFFMRRLVVLIPVDIGKAPEEGVISHILCHLKIVDTVFSLRRAVILGHGFSGDLLIEVFYVSQFFGEGFFR